VGGPIPPGSPPVPTGVGAPYHARVGDEAILTGVALADPDATTELVRRYQARVYGLALAVTRDAALADDVAQDAFVRAWRAAATYDPRRGTVTSWLLTITRNCAIDAIRARRQVPTDGEQLDALLHATLAGPDPSEAATTHVEADRIAGRLRALPPEQARAVVLMVIGGCTAAEVAAREGIPLGTAKTRVRDGLRKLRAAIGVAPDGARP